MPQSLVILALTVIAVARLAPPAAAAGASDSIRIGDVNVGDLVPEPEGFTVRVDVDALEPHTLIVESADADVRVRVESLAGERLAEDDDSGVETNAHLVWTPPGAGSYVIRVMGREVAGGTARVILVRGSVDPTPPDSARAALDYWTLARHGALVRGDTARRERAAAMLARLDGLPDAAAAESARRESDAAVAEARSLLNGARSAASSGRADDARRMISEVVERLATVDDAAADEIPFDLCFVAFPIGAHQETRTALERVVTNGRSSRLDAHPTFLSARGNLASTLESLGDLPGALSLHAETVAVKEKTLPPDHESLLAAYANFALARRSSGDLAGARELQEKVLSGRVRNRPEGDPATQQARGDLAATIGKMGDLRGARELEEEVLAAAERTYPDDHPRLQVARGSLAQTLRKMGEMKPALALEQKALANLLKTLPADNPTVQMARCNLALTMRELGDLPGARALLESALAVLEASLPETHPYLQLTRGNLAIVTVDMGDLPGAKAVFEKVLAIQEKSLADESPDLQLSRMNLAHVMLNMGEIGEALALFEKVLTIYRRIFPDYHPALLGALENLAVARLFLGDFAAARTAFERVAATRAASLGAQHPDTLLARDNIALAMRSQGDLAGARAVEEEVLALREKALVADHPDLPLARFNVAETAAAQRDWKRVASAVADLSRGETRRFDLLASLSLRAAIEGAARMDGRLSGSLSFARLLPSDLSGPIGLANFAWAETRRSLSSPAVSSGASFAADRDLASLRDAALAARRRVADLVAGLGSSEDGLRPDADAVAGAVRARDLEDARLRKALVERGIGLVAIDVESVAKALPPKAAAVSYLRYARTEFDEIERHRTTTRDHLLAHVVLKDGGFRRIELGPMEAIESAARLGRQEVGAPLLRGATIASEGSEGPAGGEALRELVLDPILKEVGAAATTLFVCLDDALHLSPIDALPLGCGVVGDKYVIRVETSFARLVGPKRTAVVDPSPTMLVMGGIDYDADRELHSSPPNGDTGLVAASAPPVATARGERDGTSFSPLRGTRDESAAIADLFAEAFGGAPALLRGGEATKAAFHERAPGARYVHLATHGYFASESVKSRLDADPAAGRAGSRTSLEAAVSGLSPMALCGLALSGANRGMDSFGRVPGILTAEEPSGADLSHCDIAVLSACETNVGIRRAGQGIASLQAALHAAGARTAITSLWKVDDERTRELMVDFYRRIWIEKKGKAEALWEAKKALRAKGAPARDWAGWVLTGEAD